MSAQLPLSRFAVARAAQRRAEPGWAAAARQSNRTRVLAINDHSVPVTDELSLIWVHPDSLELTDVQFEANAVLLGVDDERDYVAIVNEAATVAAAAWVHLREVGAQLSAHDVGLAVTAVAMSQWHGSHRFCPRCGGSTSVSQAGWARVCESDGTEHYPRTEPAMIVAVNDAAGRILLGRRTGWPDGWFSTLAGFVEAGESVEACVVREVQEESGIQVDPGSLRYLGSQPWPYPASLMLGYRATAVSTDIEHDESEMAEVLWYSRSEFEQACRTEQLKVPGRVTIAWHLIADWYGGEIPMEWSRR
jgi:NAD+ diphosphatase